VVAVHWPRISIVTPSFNQAPYLEATITSVLDQNYPALEYILVDGGSSDGSVEIIRKYERHLSYWVSEQDNGQADAINKGMAHATGELCGYLNSDDIYLPCALTKVAEAYRRDPDADLFHGDCRLMDKDGRTIGRKRASITTFAELVDVWGVWWCERNFVQPEVFWTRRIAERVGPFCDLFMVMDYEYWTRILRMGAKVHSIPEEIAAFRFTPTQKSNQRERSTNELLQVIRPLLWDQCAPIRTSHRLRLQAQWLYQQRFLPRIADSEARGDSRARRLIGGLGVGVRNPKLLLSEEYRRRLLRAARLGGVPRAAVQR
jgi:hypothetical protein